MHPSIVETTHTKKVKPREW